MSEHDHTSCACGCCHGHDHPHEHDHDSRGTVIRIILAAVLLIAAALLPVKGVLRAVVFAVPYLIIGGEVLLDAVRNLLRGKLLDEDFLMTIATVGAFATGEYPEAVFVMLFFQIGELFEHYAVGRSRKSIAALMDIRPDHANVERGGTAVQVSPETVTVGEIIVVKPGERIPLDGVVLEGASTLDTAALTGESAPRSAAAGDDVISGCVNQTGLLRVRVTKSYGESTVARILELVEHAGSRKAKAEHFITKFARYYTPAVVIGAVLLAVLPPLLGGGDWGKWFHQALVFLVVSCPCALVISIPMSFFGGIGGASRAGILVKGGNYLEALAKTEIVVFDKTGTLTRGEFRVTALHPEGCGADQLLELAALAECWSDHPISRSIRDAWEGEANADRVSDARELPGLGVQAKIDGRTIRVGSQRLMAGSGIDCPAVSEIGTVVHVAADGDYLGHLVVADEIKPGAEKVVSTLKAAGVKRTVMLTGDTGKVGMAVAAQLGLDEVHAQLLPGDKVDRVEQLLKGKPDKGTLVFVGDGINDAPVLARADVGVAMGALGSDAAIEAADVVLMDDDPAKVAKAIHIARRTLRIVTQNIVLALGVKAVVLVMGIFGAASMWLGVFADVGVAMLAILNAMRALNVKKG